MAFGRGLGAQSMVQFGGNGGYLCTMKGVEYFYFVAFFFYVPSNKRYPGVFGRPRKATGLIRSNGGEVGSRESGRMLTPIGVVD